MKDARILTAIRHALVGTAVWMALAAMQQAAAADAPQPDSLAPQQAGAWTCPMHAEIHRHEPGKCPVCKMKLVKAKPKNV